MIIQVENSKKSTKTMLEIIFGFSKTAKYKVNIQKPSVFLYTRNEKLETNFRSIIHNRIKYEMLRDKSYRRCTRPVL